MNATRTLSSTSIMAWLVGLLALSISGGLALGADHPAAKLVKPGAIRAELGQAGHVRVLVEFTIKDSAVAGNPARAMLIERKVAIASMQQKLISRHFGSAALSRPASGFARGLRLFEVTPMFAITLNGQELDKLINDSEIERIYPDRLEMPALQDSVPLIGMTGADGAYVYGATGKGQVVAVLDTGAQASHPFLAGKVIGEACYSNAGGAGVTLCPDGAKSQAGPGAAEATTAECFNGSEVLCDHGTHVAGIAVGKNPDPGIPPNGVAKEAELVVVQIFTRFNDATICDGAGNTPCVLTYLSDSLAGLEWVYVNKNNLGGRKLAAVNMSFGGGSFSTYCEDDPRKTVLDLLRDSGVAPVAASGNEYQSNAIIAPACVPSAVAVGATNLDDTRALFSNESQLMVDLMAPGLSILSSVPVSLYADMSGTSMAAPHVAGAFAAIKSRLPQASVNDIENALKATGIPIISSDQTHTKPRIQVNAALEALGARIKRTIAISRTGEGAIHSEPSGIDCGAVCTAEFDDGTVVTLTANPQPGYRFGVWGGACSGSSTTCQVGMDADHSVTATFIQTFPLSASPSSQGTFTSDPQGIDCGLACSHDFDIDTHVTLTAKPEYGFRLDAWSGACSGTSPICSVTMDAAKTVSASFVELPKVLLRMLKPTSGHVSSTPAGIDCGGKSKLCRAQFPETTEVILSATPNPGYKVKKWTGCTGISGDICTVTLNQPVSKVKVTFSRLPKYPLKVVKTKLGAITSSPAGLKCGFNAKSCRARFFQGSSVTLLPVAKPGHAFQGWEGACSGSASCTLLMDGKQEARAIFQ